MNDYGESICSKTQGRARVCVYTYERDKALELCWGGGLGVMEVAGKENHKHISEPENV